ncbi:MAG: hypothetical protein WAN34_02040 [Acidimicrobiia bacterium]
MTQTANRAVARARAPRVAGYVVAIGVNVVILVVANNLLDWGWLPFLTSDFANLLWLIDLSMLATIGINLIYIWYDPGWFKSCGQIVTNAMSIVVLARMLQIFPFDFSETAFDWSMITRAVLILALVGSAIGLLVEMFRLPGRLDR